MSPEARATARITSRPLRLSVGLEAEGDLLVDLGAGLSLSVACSVRKGALPSYH